MGSALDDLPDGFELDDSGHDTLPDGFEVDSDQPQSTGALERLGRGLANAPRLAAKGLVNSAIGLGGMFEEAGRIGKFQAPENLQSMQDTAGGWIDKAFQWGDVSGLNRIAPVQDEATTLPQKAADIAGQGASQALAAMAIPVAGGAGLASKIGAEGLRGFLMGSSSGDPAQAARDAALWAAGGGVASIPGKTLGKVLLRTAGQAAVPVVGAAIDPNQKVLSENTGMQAVAQGLFGAMHEIPNVCGLLKCAPIEEPPPQQGPANPYETPPEGYSTPLMRPRELTEWEQLKKLEKETTPAAQQSVSAEAPGESRSWQGPIQEAAPEPRALFRPAEKPLEVAPEPPSPEVQGPKSLSLGALDQSRSVVEWNGQRGKLRVRDDGTFFTPSGTNQEVRIYGAAPDAQPHEVEGLSVLKTKNLLRQVEPSPAINTESAGSLRSMRRNQGATVPPLVTSLGGGALGAGIGYATGDDEQDREARALRFGIAGALLGASPALPSTKSLLRRAAEYENNPTARGVGNKVANSLVKWTRLGEEPAALTARERGRGFASLQGHGIEEAKARVSPEMAAAVDADPRAQSALTKFIESPGTVADETSMRALVPKEYADAIVAAHQAQRNIQAEATKAYPPSDPKSQMFHDTEGTYTTQSYGIFKDPKNWQRDPVAFRQVVDERALANPGVPRSQIERELNADLAAKLEGNKGAKDSAGQRVSQSLFIHKEDLTPAYKTLLGEITHPGERQMFTAEKLLKNAASFKTINALDAAMTERGTKMTMTPQELNAAKASGKDVGDYVRLPDSPGLGKLAGKYAPVSLANQITTEQNIWERFFNNPLLKGPTSVAKAAVTVANWATHARQWIQTPFMALAARGNPTLLPDALDAMSHPTNPIWKELRENNIVGANFSHNEFKNHVGKLGIQRGLLSKAWGGLKDLYGLPDDIVRALSYVSAKKRFGGNIDKAVEFVNKFTMNYGAQSRLVNLARNVPVINPFVSFMSEMMRVSKNLAVEAVHGSTVADKAWALASLGGLWGIGTVVSQARKRSMTEAERKEWEQTEKLMPSFQRAQTKVPLGKNIAGGRDFIGLSSITPAGDLMGMADTLARGDWEAMVKEHPIVGPYKNPIFTAIADIVQEKDHFSGADIPFGSQKMVNRAIQPFVPPVVGFTTPTGERWGGYEGQKLSDLARNGGQVVNPRTGQLDTTERAATRNLLGINVQSASKPRLLKSAAYERDQALQKINSDAKRLLSVPRTNDDKQAIIRKVSERRREVIEDFQKKLK